LDLAARRNLLFNSCPLWFWWGIDMKKKGILFALSLAFAVAPAVAAPTVKNDATLSPGAHQTIVNNVRLYYTVDGRSDGVPLVYLHGGFGEGSQSFDMLIGDYLEPSLRVVYLDQRGSGRSERPWDHAYSLDLLVDDIEKLRQKWGVPKIALIGHSAGTIEALEYAAKYPEHVTRVILAASASDIPGTFNVTCDHLAKVNPAAYARAVAAAKPGSRQKCNFYADGVFTKHGASSAFVHANMFPNPGIEEKVNKADSAGGVINTGDDIFDELVKQGILEYRFAKADKVTMPVLIIAGGEDHQANVEPQRKLAEELPDGKIIVYAGAGHFMWVEQPRRFAHDVISFLNGSAVSAERTPAQ
jgi:proline iminopeptidase